LSDQAAYERLGTLADLILDHTYLAHVYGQVLDAALSYCWRTPLYRPLRFVQRGQYGRRGPEEPTSIDEPIPTRDGDSNHPYEPDELFRWERSGALVLMARAR